MESRYHAFYLTNSRRWHTRSWWEGGGDNENYGSERKSETISIPCKRLTVKSFAASSAAEAFRIANNNGLQCLVKEGELLDLKRLRSAYKLRQKEKEVKAYREKGHYAI